MNRPGYKDRVRRFWSHDQGVSAIELALVLPVLVIIFFGSAMYAIAYLDSEASDRASSIVADLVSRQNTVDNPLLIKTGAVYKSLIRKPDRFVAIRISSIKKIDDKLSVDWSYADGMAVLKKDGISALSLPTIANNDSLIFVESSIKPTFLINPWKITLSNFTNGIAVRPRFTSAITKTDS